MAYIVLALISLAVWYPMGWVLPTLAAMILFFAGLFYSLMFNLVAGLSVSSINTEFDLSKTWTSQVTHIGAVGVLIGSGGWFLWAGIFAAPWILVNLSTNVLSTLVKLELLKITDKD